jgi:hypothetical protein
MDNYILRSQVEEAFINYINSSLGNSIKEKCIDYFSNPLSIGQKIDFWKITEERNVNCLLNVYCDSATYNEEEIIFVLVFTFETLREYENNLLKTNITEDNVWSEPIRVKTIEFMGLIAKAFSDMLIDVGVAGSKRWKIVEVVTGEPYLQADTTIQQDMAIEISINRCLIN